MASFQPKSLSDEDIARILDLCSSTQFVLEREEQGVQIWTCPICGATVRSGAPIRVSGVHYRRQFEQVYA